MRRRRPRGEPCIFYVARRSSRDGFVWLAREGSSRLEALPTRQHVAGGPGHVACPFRRAPAAGSSLVGSWPRVPCQLVCLDLGWSRFLGLHYGELSGHLVVFTASSLILILKICPTKAEFLTVPRVKICHLRQSFFSCSISSAVHPILSLLCGSTFVILCPLHAEDDGEADPCFSLSRPFLQLDLCDDRLILAHKQLSLFYWIIKKPIKCHYN